MSAFIVGTDTINRIVNAISKAHHSNGCLHNQFGVTWNRFEFGGINVHHEGDLTRLGTLIYAMNEEAVAQRYPNHQRDKAPRYEWKGGNMPLPMDDMKAFQSISVLRYQCDEGNVPDCRLYRAIDDFRKALAMQIVRAIPVFDALAWE